VLAVQASATVWGVIEMPVPETLIVAGELVALLEIVTEALTAPAADGANCTVTVTDWLGVRVSPEATPLVLKAALETPTFEIVTLALPLLVSTALSELLLPTFTFPKLKLVVLSPSTFVEATPVPLSGIDIGELGELLVSMIEPDTAPAVVGANTALNVVLVPAAIVSGALMPEILNPAPVTLADEIVRPADPPFDTVIVCELLVPVETLPKAAVDGVAAIWGCVPVPDIAIVAGDPAALVTTEMLPLAPPADVGAKTALNEALDPALMVIGIVGPFTL
jgi:hypothetical protein